MSLNNKQKSNILSNIVYAEMDELDKRVDDFFQYIYLNKENTWLKDVYEKNLCADIEYLLSKIEYLIRLWKDDNVDMQKVEYFFNYIKSDYIEYWYKSLIKNDYYNKEKDDVYTEDEVIELQRKKRDMAKELLWSFNG